MRPSGYEPDEMPTAPPRDINMVPKTGIEPVREVSPAGFKVLCVCQFRHFGIPRGYVLLSQAVAHQVPSPLKSLTSVFGMGTGVSSLL